VNQPIVSPDGTVHGYMNAGTARSAVRESGNRARNLDKLADEGRMDLFYKILLTLLILEDRNISQQDVANHLGRNRTWVRWVLVAEPKLSHKRLEKNLDAIDLAITEITVAREEN